MIVHILVLHGAVVELDEGIHPVLREEIRLLDGSEEAFLFLRGGLPEVGHVDEHFAFRAVAEELLLAAAEAFFLYVGQVDLVGVAHWLQQKDCNRNEKKESIGGRNGGKGRMWEGVAQLAWLSYIQLLSCDQQTLFIFYFKTHPTLLVPPYMNKYYYSFDINGPLALHLHLHLRSPVHPRPLLQKFAEVPDWAVLPRRTHRVLVISDLGNGAEPLSQPHQFFELADLIWKDGLDEVEQFIDDKIYDCDVVEVPAHFGTVVFVIPEHRLDLAAPVIMQAFLFLRGERRPRGADEAENGIPEVESAPDAVYLDLVVQRAAEEIAPAHLFDDVVNHGSWAGHDKVPVLEEGQVLDDPSLGLGVLELGPLIRCKVGINIGHMQILADQPANLYFPSKGVITYHNGLDRRSLLFFVGTHGPSLFNLYILSFSVGITILYTPGRTLEVLLVTKARWAVWRMEGKSEVSGEKRVHGKIQLRVFQEWFGRRNEGPEEWKCEDAAEQNPCDFDY